MGRCFDADTEEILRRMFGGAPDELAALDAGFDLYRVLIDTAQEQRALVC